MLVGIAIGPPVGGYFSLVKIVTLLVLALPWLLLAPRVHRDAERVLAPKDVWSVRCWAPTAIPRRPAGSGWSCGCGCRGSWWAW